MSASDTVAEHNVDERTRNLADASSKVVLRSHASPVEDIRAERESASFRSQELAEYLNEGPDKLKRRSLCSLYLVALTSCLRLCSVWVT